MAKQKINPNQINMSRNYTGNNGYWTIIGGVQYCWGLDAIANSPTTITFGRAFSATPTIICTVQDTNNQTAWVYSSSSTGAQLRQLYTGNPLNVHWIAIGPA